ncbi:MAG: branched-chain amino acid ABC transporter permease [Burkholderiales bacterium]|nr:MAG: branched-chain amino acid ABC transporter permease [Burkholderiales bacterium]
MQWLEALVQGILLGGLYAQYALGMTLMFGVMRIVNVAHGDLLILLSFCAISLSAALGVGPVTVTGVLVPLAALGGYLLQRVLLNRVVGPDPLPSLIATFGLSTTIQNLLLEIYTADARSLVGDGLESASVALGPLNLGLLSLLTLLAAVVLTVGVHLMLRHTAFGLSLRASAADAEASALTGVNPRHVYAGATSIAVGVLGLSAVFQALRVTVSPADGAAQLIHAFEAVIIGGMGSVWGAFWGAMVLGIAQVVGARIDAGWGTLAGHLVFLAVLGLRPRGLFSRSP